MATYNDLTSLDGLQVGDVIQYSKDTTIDFKGYTVTVKLNSSGLAKADINTSLFPSTVLTYSPKAGHCLCYGDTFDVYKRIMVAGDGGSGGSGGGLVADVVGSTGGSQTAGGQTHEVPGNAGNASRR